MNSESYSSRHYDPFNPPVTGLSIIGETALNPLIDVGFVNV